jgi:hypothetical protein
MAPFVVWIGRISLGLLLACSLAVWAAALYSQLNIPTWPVEGVWFFNPFAWQLQFVLGFVLSRPRGFAQSILAHRTPLRVLGLVIAVGGLWLALINWSPNPFELPEPQLFFMNDKTFLSPLRIIHMLGLTMLLVGAFDAALRWDKFVYLAQPLCLLGRNSLHVFCAGSLLSLAGQVTRFAAPVGLVTDTIVLLTGVAVMLAVAWGNEWRINLSR